MGVRGSNPRGTTFKFFHLKLRNNGGLAQLARALALQARGQGFDSLVLHKLKNYFEKEVTVEVASFFCLYLSL